MRKKQYPPVFWQRLYFPDGTSGSRTVGEVEVGGWPLPDVYFYDEAGELVETRTHTENYNGFFNAYVPERSVEVKRIDQIRHCIVFHQVGETTI